MARPMASSKCAAVHAATRAQEGRPHPRASRRGLHPTLGAACGQCRTNAEEIGGAVRDCPKTRYQVRIVLERVDGAYDPAFEGTKSAWRDSFTELRTHIFRMPRRLGAEQLYRRIVAYMLVA